VSLLLELRLALGLEINTGRNVRAALALPRGGLQLEEHELELLSSDRFKERVRNVSVFIVFFFRVRTYRDHLPIVPRPL
jgi:hypothetical protein